LGVLGPSDRGQWTFRFEVEAEAEVEVKVEVDACPTNASGRWVEDRPAKGNALRAVVFLIKSLRFFFIRKRIFKSDRP